MPKVSLVKCGSYDGREVESAVKTAVDLLGGIENFVRPGERVLLKPNLLTDAAPEKAVTTHPQVLRAVIRLIKPLTKNIYCGDSPSVWGKSKDIERVYQLTGVGEVCIQEGVELVYFTRPKLYNGYYLTDWLDKCDRLISLPKFKTHALTVLTAGVKNLFGLVVGMQKLAIHRECPSPRLLARALVDIYQIRKPDLTILDGIMAMEGQGPGSSGSPKSQDLIAASPCALSLDMILAGIMGVPVRDIPVNREALKRGLGPGDVNSIAVLGDKGMFCGTGSFKLPKTDISGRLPAWLFNILKNFLKIKMVSVPELCKLCGVCQQACPAEAVYQRDKRMLMDERKCILCLCCQEVCPHKAVEVKRSLLLRLLGM